jgi:hypothetical protein
MFTEWAYGNTISLTAATIVAIARAALTENVIQSKINYIFVSGFS